MHDDLYIDSSEYIVFLREQKGLKYSQIAEKTGKHPEAVRSIYRRATGKLKTAPQDQYQSHKITSSEAIKVAFVTDLHVPYHDKHAVELAMNVLRDFNPDVLVCGSDGIDFYSISKYNKHPDRKDKLQYEIDSWIEVQSMINTAAPAATRQFITGNHEDRLRRYLWTRPEMYSLRALTLENLLELDTLGIEFAGEEVSINNTLVIKHGSRIRKESAYTAKAELEEERYSVNLMTGHTHRGGTHYATSRRGLFRADECFCLCDLEPDYVRKPNWQQGMTVATVMGKKVHIEPIPFFGVKTKKLAFWRDSMYTI